MYIVRSCLKIKMENKKKVLRMRVQNIKEKKIVIHILVYSAGMEYRHSKQCVCIFILIKKINLVKI